jgi:hypothetical protein
MLVRMRSPALCTLHTKGPEVSSNQAGSSKFRE